MTDVVIANRLEEAQRAEPDHVGGIFGLIEGDPYVRLRRQIVNFVGPRLLDDPPQAGRVAEIAIVKLQAGGARAVAAPQMVDAARRKARCAAHDAVDFVAFLQQKFGEIRAVLARDSGDQRNFVHRFLSACLLCGYTIIPRHHAEG